MKYTEKFFSFPIRIYDSKSLPDIDDGGEGDWIVGVVRMPFEDMRYSCWYDGFSRSKEVDEVSKEGFDATIVSNKMHGQFNCVWNRKKFEEKLNEGMEKYERIKEEEKRSEAKVNNALSNPYQQRGYLQDNWGSLTDPK